MRQERQKARLVLEDGSVWGGMAFGARGTRVGEVVFNTSLTGYQEILTDPSYAGQMVLMTASQIGNVGMNAEDNESSRAWMEGFVVRELSERVSNWRSTETLEAWLETQAVVGITEVDTRAIVRRLRETGSLRGVLTTDGQATDEALIAMARSWQAVFGHDLTGRVTCREPYVWKEATPQEWECRRWSNASGGGKAGFEGGGGESLAPTPISSSPSEAAPHSSKKTTNPSEAAPHSSKKTTNPSEAAPHSSKKSTLGPSIGEKSTPSPSFVTSLSLATLGSKGGEFGQAAPPSGAGLHLVVVDFGVKRNILRRLASSGCKVTVVPATTKASQILDLQPQGVVLSNGPGDPAAVTYALPEVRALMGRLPILGICLGHQILGLALGGRTLKLKFGHHGGNQPIQTLATGKVEICAQNHNYAVDLEHLPDVIEVTHLNLNDRTCEGFRHKSLPIFGLQHHPEAGPGPHDGDAVFLDFLAQVKEAKQEKKGTYDAKTR